MRSWLNKISRSPSASLLVLIGSFIAGIILATLIFSQAVFVAAAPFFVGCMALAVVCLVAVKNNNARLLLAAGLLFLSGGARYLSTASDPVNLLAYLPFLVPLKTWLIGSVNQMLPEPQAGFMNGLLVGGGVQSPELKAAFVATGTAHVMALSGWNISLINRWMEKTLVFFRLSKAMRWIVATTLVVLFVIMTGASASLVRAAAMSLIGVLAAAGGRRSAPGRAVLYAACLMLLASPRIIAADLGFLLSVAATLGMVYLAPFFKPFADRLPERFDIRATVAGTCGATLGTLPVVLVAFGQSSLVALPTNLLLLPFVAPTMFVGFFGALLRAVVSPLAPFCDWLAHLFTAYDISVVRLMARVPGASIAGVSFNLLAGVIMALGMVWMVVKNYDRVVKKKI